MDKQKAIAVAIQIPAGDYTNVRKNKKLGDALSSDLSGFFRATDSPQMFYVVTKHYLSERIGLNKMLPGDSVIESSIHATIVTLMTELIATGVHEVIHEEEDKPHKEFIGKVLRKLRRALKSNQRMKEFDRFCTSSYGVSSEKPGYSKTFESDDSDDADLDIHIDSHLNAKS